ncbi:MAG: hypothetical protein JW755_01155 [Candidatus Aminicenantes bacterium]|nr:hypothetical protein [Candidatus Aminicenantes bacterium]
MKKATGRVDQIKPLIFIILFSTLLFLQTVYSDQRKTVPDNAPSGRIKDICLIATPRLAEIPELYGFWDPGFPVSREAVWSFSGSGMAETWMSYAEMRQKWPYTYLRYTSKGQRPNAYWDQDMQMEAYYFQGQISVTISSGLGSSLWQDDWQSRAEYHNRTYAKQTLTIYSMGQAPEIQSQVLPGPIKTCEFKQKQYCGGRFQAELQIFKDKYRLEQYAIAGSRGGQYTILRRVVDWNYITNIRAQVKGVNPAIEISLNAVSKDSKPVNEALVDQIISTILGAAFEASGMPNPCGDILVPSEKVEPVRPHPVCADAQVSGNLVGHMLSAGSDTRILRPGGDGGQIELRPWFGMPLFEGDTIIAGGEDKPRAVFLSEWMRSGWQRSINYYHWDKYGNPQRPFTYRVPDKDSVTDFMNTLSQEDQLRYLSALMHEGLLIRLGKDTVSSVCVDTLINELFPPKSLLFRLKQGIMWVIRRDKEPSPTHVFVDRRIPGMAGFRGTEFVIQCDPETDVASIHVNEGEVSFTNEGEERVWNVPAGQSIVVGEYNIPEIRPFNPGFWKKLTSNLISPPIFPSNENEIFIREKAPVDYIPELNAVVTGIKFYEGDKNGVPYGQRKYRERFARSNSRFIYWELNLRHPAPERRLDFAVDAVWYGPDGSEFVRQTLNTYLEGTWTNSYHPWGRGWDEPDNWIPGIYIVELFHKGQKIAISAFEIFDEGGGGSKKTYAIPSLRADVTKVNFYEGGYEVVLYGQRVYGVRFSKSSTRAIWWELNLEHPDPGRRVDFVIEAVFYRWDGSEIARQINNTAVLPTWTTSYHSLGWGWKEAGNWAAGTYRVELFVEGQQAASGTFEITER